MRRRGGRSPIREENPDVPDIYPCTSCSNASNQHNYQQREERQEEVMPYCFCCYCCFLTHDMLLLEQAVSNHSRSKYHVLTRGRPHFAKTGKKRKNNREYSHRHVEHLEAMRRTLTWLLHHFATAVVTGAMTYCGHSTSVRPRWTWGEGVLSVGSRVDVISGWHAGRCRDHRTRSS